MKAEQKQKEFTPVIVTLETQEEVDTLHAILNHSWVIHGTCFGDECYSTIEPFASENKRVIHKQITSQIKAFAQKNI